MHESMVKVVRLTIPTAFDVVVAHGVDAEQKDIRRKFGLDVGGQFAPEMFVRARHLILGGSDHLKNKVVNYVICALMK